MKPGRLLGDDLARVRREFHLGTWNVLSLYHTESLRILEQQLGNYKASITALQEGFRVKKDSKLVIDFKPVNARMCSLRIKGKFFNYTLICAHAPIEASTEDEKEEFYELLEGVYEKSPRMTYRYF